MRLLLLLAGLALGRAASAQLTVPDAPRPVATLTLPEPNRRLAENVGMVLAGYAATAATISAAVLVGEHGGEYLLFFTPFAAGMGVSGAGHLMGARGSGPGAVRAAALGALPGALLAVGGAFQSNSLTDDAAGIAFIGFLAYFLVPPLTGVAGFRRVTPTAGMILLPPEAGGGRVSVVALRIGL